ncbi:MAG: hypothetical protein H6810_01730 [Phycisphaeraceae bacterium]|nr:MAG: hypothetical protein H6810_01730 [Phycisphaeraceae bacterium]
MARQFRIHLTLAAGCAAACVFSAVAQQGDPVLAGPKVDATSSPKVVERNLDGTMRPPEIPIAEKALELIELDGATRDHVDVLLATRAAVVDTIVKENLEALNKMRTEREAGGPEVRREHMQTLMKLFEPVIKDGPLEKQIADLLPEEKRAEYLDLIHQSRQEMMAARRARAGGGPDGVMGGPPEDPMLFDDNPPPADDADAPPPPPPGRQADAPRRGQRGQGRPGAAERGQRRGADGGQPGIGDRAQFRDRLMAMGDLRIEIQRSVERVTGERRDRMDEMVKTLNLTPEQAEKVKAILADGRAKMQQAEDKRAARQALMQSLGAVLTPEQLQAFREHMGGPNRGDRPRRQGPPPAGDKP